MLIFTYLFRILDNLTVVVDKKLSQNGKDLFLSCQVKHCCQKPAGWIKWTSDNESTTLFIDVKDLLDDKVSKYHGGINDRGFFLVVRNVSKEDIIMPYSCTYGFLISNKKMLLKADLSYSKLIALICSSIYVKCCCFVFFLLLTLWNSWCSSKSKQMNNPCNYYNCFKCRMRITAIIVYWLYFDNFKIQLSSKHKTFEFMMHSCKCFKHDSEH